MATVPLLVDFALLLGLSFFFGLAFEEFHVQGGERRPGGVRTFPLLALTGALLYLLDPARLLPLAAGLVVLGLWLYAWYRRAVAEPDGRNERSVELVAPACNLLACLLGPIALTQPHWLAVGVTVAAVLLLTARERLHEAARRIGPGEIVTAGKFLILTGLVLPLLPNEPVTSLTAVTPYQAWLALLAVCTLSYASYLLQRYVAPAESDLLVAVLGGLYSSTATTVVLARRAGAEPALRGRAAAGIALATAMMYPRILAMVAVFDLALARALAPPLLGLFAAGLGLAALLYRRAGGRLAAAAPPPPANPLELSTAALFALLFVAISLASHWVAARFGSTGLDVLAAIVGVTDVDPFVLNLANGSAGALAAATAATAILIATASNNLLKAAYTLVFAGRRGTLAGVAALVALAAAALAVALLAGG